MISVVIATLNDTQRLTATLAALAPAAVDGFVREVIIADGGSSDGTLEVAEDAGADVVAGGFGEAIAAARQPWVLILRPGSRPQVGWEQSAHAHMRDYPDWAGWFELALPTRGSGARMREMVAQAEGAMLGRVRPAQGLLIANQSLKALGPVESHEDVLRRLDRSRMRWIGAKALLM